MNGVTFQQKNPWVKLANPCLPVFLFLVFTSCNILNPRQTGSSDDILFRPVDLHQSGITFINRLTENNEVNYFFYPDLYEGGGIAVGDINNDGLADIYFTSILERNALFLNKGGLKFEDISVSAGVQAIGKWTRGATMADVNSDGYLDIYVSVGGALEDKRNLLYINNGDNTFSEQAEKFGIADESFSLQSAFFDFDNDGDIDLYVGNNPPAPFQSRNAFYAEKMTNPGPGESDRLYANMGNGSFVDISTESGITNYGLTLGLSVSDFNGDGWLDIYVSNDFNSPDYFYVNQRDGTFRNEIQDQFMHTAQFGMGSDAADFNNDGFIDLVQLDMSYQSNTKKKTNMPTMWPEQFYEMIDLGLHQQYMRNCLQLNTGLNTFSDVANFAGITSTDWSWSALFFDANNDGLKDLFITNGMRREVNDNDFLNYVKEQDMAGKINPANTMDLLDRMPVNRVDNYLYLNKGDLKFYHKDGNFGLSHKGFSHGAAYADLDNDGDLDVVVNHMDDVAQIYENLTSGNPGSNYLRIKLASGQSNRDAIGAKVKLYTSGKFQLLESMPTRGYISSVDRVLHFGMASATKADSICVIWPTGAEQWLYDVESGQILLIEQPLAPGPQHEKPPISRLFTCQNLKLEPLYFHEENEFNDFDREVLLPHKMSQLGPAVAAADVNGDGLDDFYVGGARGFPGRLYLQSPSGDFVSEKREPWARDRQFEDVSALFFDANGDGHPDLYIASGGNEEDPRNHLFQDRIYINDGLGNFQRNDTALPKTNSSSSRVKSSDFDRDGDLDLFVGGRQIPGKYPAPASSFLLRNDSDADIVKFTDITVEAMPMLKDIGMVTDGVWMDYNGDGWPDLMLGGEWMKLTLFQNNRGIFEDVSKNIRDNHLGWWSALHAADLDSDGDPDLVAGNLGLNYKYKASPEQPFEIYSEDFDDNGKRDIVLAYYNQDQIYPLRGRTCSSEQVPMIREKFAKYTDFGNASLIDVYGEDKLSTALQYKSTSFASTIYMNEDGIFQAYVLGSMAQLSSINVIHVDDFNNDSRPDLFLGGNLYESEVETPRSDASFGLYMTGNGNGWFEAVAGSQSGLNIKGEVRELALLSMANGQTGMLIARNEDTLLWVSPNNSTSTSVQ